MKKKLLGWLFKLYKNKEKFLEDAMDLIYPGKRVYVVLGNKGRDVEEEMNDIRAFEDFLSDLEENEKDHNEDVLAQAKFQNSLEGINYDLETMLDDFDKKKKYH